MEPFATFEDLLSLAGNLGDEKICFAKQYLSVVSDCLREAADQVGKDLDVMIEKSPWLGNIARAVTLEVAVRAATSFSDQVPMTQISQSAGGYTASGTYLVPGGGVYIKRSELARLGLRRQRMGGIDLYGISD